MAIEFDRSRRDERAGGPIVTPRRRGRRVFGVVVALVVVVAGGFRTSCSPPPPSLPDAGEQPADPDAAEAEIRDAMSTLYGIVGSDEVGGGLIDDTTGVAEAREQVQDGGYADDAAGATANVDELVFTTPEEAWFRYSIDTSGNDFDNRHGIAVLVDGVWKITRATVCQDLALAGGECGGDWRVISPPGAGTLD